MQWSTFITGSQQYQGEITDEKAVQHAYTRKLRQAQENGSLLDTQDWSGLRIILDMVITAFE